MDEGQAKQPVATPCRSDIPEVNDPSAPQPVPGVIRISQKAMESRMRRVFAPNIEGKYKVSSEILQLFKNKKGKKTLTQIFQSCGFDTDHGTKKKFPSTSPEEIPKSLKPMKSHAFWLRGWPFVIPEIDSIFFWGANIKTKPQEAFIQECDVLKSDLLQNDLDVEGEFLTEQYMTDELKWSECFVRKRFERVSNKNGCLVLLVCLF